VATRAAKWIVIAILGLWLLWAALRALWPTGA